MVIFALIKGLFLTVKQTKTLWILTLPPNTWDWYGLHSMEYSAHLVAVFLEYTSIENVVRELFISPSVLHHLMKIYPLLDYWEMKILIMIVSLDTEASCHLVAHFILKKHIHTFEIINPKIHCYMNSVIQLLFSVIRTISYNFQFNPSTESSISKFYLK